MISRLIGEQVLKRVSGGRINRPNRIQAMRRLPSLLKLTVALLRDARVPVWQRAGVVGLVALIISPIDIVGDIPVVGQFWDFTLSVVVMDAFIQMAPRNVVDEHIQRLNLQGKFPARDK